MPNSRLIWSLVLEKNIFKVLTLFFVNPRWRSKFVKFRKSAPNIWEEYFSRWYLPNFRLIWSLFLEKEIFKILTLFFVNPRWRSKYVKFRKSAPNIWEEYFSRWYLPNFRLIWLLFLEKKIFKVFTLFFVNPRWRSKYVKFRKSAPIVLD
jgi:hypothetical protein